MYPSWVGRARLSLRIGPASPSCRDTRRSQNDPARPSRCLTECRTNGTPPDWLENLGDVAHPIPHPIYSTDRDALAGLGSTQAYVITRVGRISPPSHGRGHWFKSSIAHGRNRWKECSSWPSPDLRRLFIASRHPIWRVSSILMQGSARQLMRVDGSAGVTDSCWCRINLLRPFGHIVHLVRLRFGLSDLKPSGSTEQGPAAPRQQGAQRCSAMSGRAWGE